MAVTQSYRCHMCAVHKEKLLQIATGYKTNCCCDNWFHPGCDVDVHFGTPPHKF